jgi:hypothetical protein
MVGLVVELGGGPVRPWNEAFSLDLLVRKASLGALVDKNCCCKLVKYFDLKLRVTEAFLAGECTHFGAILGFRGPYSRAFAALWPRQLALR